MSEHPDHVYHITPFKTYIMVFLALIVLTVLTVWVAQVDFGAFNALVAFGIATVKALLVVMWFMHLKFDNNMNRAVLGVALFFLFLLYLIVAIDIATREDLQNVM